VQAETETARGGLATHGCHRGCVIRCSGVYHDKDGHYITKQPEYETVWAHGGNCGICDLDAIAQLDFLDDNYGLDTIEMGVAIGVAMEAGLLKFGDAEGRSTSSTRWAGAPPWADPRKRCRGDGQVLRGGEGPGGEGAGACRPTTPGRCRGSG
jgi:aldehyde:ferredoxin oxidoreductase